MIHSVTLWASAATLAMAVLHSGACAPTSEQGAEIKPVAASPSPSAIDAVVSFDAVQTHWFSTGLVGLVSSEAAALQEVTRTRTQLSPARFDEAFQAALERLRRALELVLMWVRRSDRFFGCGMVKMAIFQLRPEETFTLEDTAYLDPMGTNDVRIARLLRALDDVCPGVADKSVVERPLASEPGGIVDRLQANFPLATTTVLEMCDDVVPKAERCFHDAVVGYGPENRLPVTTLAMAGSAANSIARFSHFGRASHLRNSDGRTGPSVALPMLYGLQQYLLFTDGRVDLCAPAYQLRRWPLTNDRGELDLRRIGEDGAPKIRAILDEVEERCPGSVRLAMESEQP